MNARHCSGIDEEKKREGNGAISDHEREIAELSMTLTLLVTAGLVTEEKVKQARELAKGFKHKDLNEGNR